MAVVPFSDIAAMPIEKPGIFGSNIPPYLVGFL